MHFCVLSATYQFLTLSQVRNPILWSKDHRMGLISTITWSYMYLDLPKKKRAETKKTIATGLFSWGAVSGSMMNKQEKNKKLIICSLFSLNTYDVHMNCYVSTLIIIGLPATILAIVSLWKDHISVRSQGCVCHLSVSTRYVGIDFTIHVIFGNGSDFPIQFNEAISNQLMVVVDDWFEVKLPTSKLKPCHLGIILVFCRGHMDAYYGCYIQYFVFDSPKNGCKMIVTRKNWGIANVVKTFEDIAQCTNTAQFVGIKSRTWNNLPKKDWLDTDLFRFLPWLCFDSRAGVQPVSHSFTENLAGNCHGCRWELLQGGSMPGRWRGSDWGQTDQTRLGQRWGSTRSLRYWSRWNESNSWGTSDFLWSAGRHWGRFCFGITSKIDYEENDWIETYGAWPRDHAGHSSASRIAEVWILDISRKDPTQKSVWWSLEICYPGVTFWSILVTYLEIQGQVESLGLGLADRQSSWIDRLVPRCSSLAVFASVWHCWADMDSRIPRGWCRTHSWCELMDHHDRRSFYAIYWVCVSLHISHSKPTRAFWMWLVFIRGGRNSSNAVSIVSVGVSLLRRSSGSFTRPNTFQAFGVSSS